MHLHLLSGLIMSGDKLVRATELVQLLTLEKSVKGAIKLVTALKLPNLAERFSTILEVKPWSPSEMNLFWMHFLFVLNIYRKD